MSEQSPRQPRHPIRDFFRGVGEITEFARESALALIEVAIGRWPQPFGELRRRPKAPNQGMGPVERVASFPVDD